MYFGNEHLGQCFSGGFVDSLPTVSAQVATSLGVPYGLLDVVSLQKPDPSSGTAISKPLTRLALLVGVRDLARAFCSSCE